MNKYLGIVIAVLGIALAATPFLTDCTAHGMVGANGMEMGCSTNRNPELALGAGLFIVGVVTATPLSKSKGALFGLAGLAVVLGTAGILVPHTIAHTCPGPTMPCNTEEVPALTIVGGMAVAGGLTGLVMAFRKKL